MEIGIGFFVGLLAGVVVAGIAFLIMTVSRKAVKAGKSGNTAVVESQAVPPPAGAAGGKTAIRSAPSPRHTGNTVVVGSVESQDQQLHKNIGEVKELLLRLADVVGNTNDASGRAAKAFSSARSVIDRVDTVKAEDLVEAQGILVMEIDRVLKTNASLQNELDKAHDGIAEQRRQIEELRVQARIDSLTRIPNRAAFDERLREYIGLFQRSKLAFTLLILDIDHFKKINDEHGHVSGDRILRGVAAKIADCVRTNDFAARYGGEEFAVIFPGTAAAEAFMVSERMRLDVAKTNFRLDDKIIRLTVSGGLAEFGRGMDVESVIAAADKALYQAKNEGRNRMQMEGMGMGTRT